jgi:hypothetical protein
MRPPIRASTWPAAAVERVEVACVVVVGAAVVSGAGVPVSESVWDSATELGVIRCEIVGQG